MINIDNIQIQVGQWSKHNFGSQPSYRPLLGAVEELGELCHAHLKQEQGIRTNEDHQAAKEDAIGDIIIYLMDYCEREGISMADSLEAAWDQVKLRDWIAKKETGV